MTELCDLFYKYKSDKCPNIFHTYSPIYYDIFKEYKNDYKFILEIGVGTNEIMKPISGSEYQIGSSLKSWRDFFPNSMVFGLDIDNRVLFEEDRIKCFFTDQSKEESLENTISNINSYIGKNIEYDFIIDDGSHVVEHMILTFNTLKKYLRTGGIYVIEDIKFKDLDLFKKLESNEYKIIREHDGNFEWDSFIAFLKK
jgi:hypothetical protein